MASRASSVSPSARLRAGGVIGRASCGGAYSGGSGGAFSCPHLGLFVRNDFNCEFWELFWRRARSPWTSFIGLFWSACGDHAHGEEASYNLSFVVTGAFLGDNRQVSGEGWHEEDKDHRPGGKVCQRTGEAF